eukprot:758153-Hanusia_phi.AAC.2
MPSGVIKSNGRAGRPDLNLVGCSWVVSWEGWSGVEGFFSGGWGGCFEILNWDSDGGSLSAGVGWTSSKDGGYFEGKMGGRTENGWVAVLQKPEPVRGWGVLTTGTGC